VPVLTISSAELLGRAGWSASGNPVAVQPPCRPGGDGV